MINIAICDDEPSLIHHLSDQLERYAKESGEEIRITSFSNGRELMRKYDMNFELIFLDIKMDKMNGLEAAREIRKIDAKVSIIFLTSLIQYALEGYKVNATDYIVKPIKYLRLKEELHNWLTKHRQGDNPYFVTANDTGRYKVFIKSLRYIETFNRNILLHTEQENIVSYKSMKEMEVILKDLGFARCHTSFIVNLLYVKRVEKLELKLITGEIIPVSQPKRKDFMVQMADYWGDRL